MCDCEDDIKLVVGVPEYITDENGNVFVQHLGYNNGRDGRNLPVPLHRLSYLGVDKNFFFSAESPTIIGCVEKWNDFFNANPTIRKGNAYQELIRFLNTTASQLMTMPVQDMEKVKEKLGREFAKNQKFNQMVSHDYRYAIQFLQLHISATRALLNGPHRQFWVHTE